MARSTRGMCCRRHCSVEVTRTAAAANQRFVTGVATDFVGNVSYRLVVGTLKGSWNRNCAKQCLLVGKAHHDTHAIMEWDLSANEARSCETAGHFM